MKLTQLYFSAFFLSTTVIANEQVDIKNLPAVQENSYSVNAQGVSDDVDIFSIQADSTFSISENFGGTLGANNYYISTDNDSDNIRNIRAGIFMRDPDIGRIELAYQQVFFDGSNEHFYNLTSEYYFENWTLGGFFLTDELADLKDLNLYSNIYFNDNIRLEIDLLDASDNSVLKGAIQFQLPEYIGNEWMFSISYGEDLIGQNQIGLSVKYVPDFNSTLKKYYRNYSVNIKSLFFN
jgi:hypothetical protein